MEGHGAVSRSIGSQIAVLLVEQQGAQFRVLEGSRADLAEHLAGPRSVMMKKPAR